MDHTKSQREDLTLNIVIHNINRNKKCTPLVPCLTGSSTPINHSHDPMSPTERDLRY